MPLRGTTNKKINNVYSASPSPIQPHHILWPIVGPYLEAKYQTILLLVNEFDVVRKMPISIASVHRSVAHAWSHTRSHLLRCRWFLARGRKWVRMILCTFVLLRTMRNIFFLIIRNRINCSTATAQQHQLQQREKPFSIDWNTLTQHWVSWSDVLARRRIESKVFCFWTTIHQHHRHANNKLDPYGRLNIEHYSNQLYYIFTFCEYTRGHHTLAVDQNVPMFPWWRMIVRFFSLSLARSLLRGNAQNIYPTEMKKKTSPIPLIDTKELNKTEDPKIMHKWIFGTIQFDDTTHRPWPWYALLTLNVAFWFFWNSSHSLLMREAIKQQPQQQQRRRPKNNRNTEIETRSHSRWTLAVIQIEKTHNELVETKKNRKKMRNQAWERKKKRACVRLGSRPNNIV